jgi:hypothetical protein
LGEMVANQAHILYVSNATLICLNRHVSTDLQLLYYWPSTCIIGLTTALTNIYEKT